MHGRRTVGARGVLVAGGYDGVQISRARSFLDHGEALKAVGLEA